MWIDSFFGGVLRITSNYKTVYENLSLTHLLRRTRQLISLLHEMWQYYNKYLELNGYFFVTENRRNRSRVFSYSGEIRTRNFSDWCKCFLRRGEKVLDHACWKKKLHEFDLFVEMSPSFILFLHILYTLCRIRLLFKYVTFFNLR